MDTIQAHKQKIINDYINTVDLTEIDVTQIKIDLHQLLGETPGVQLNYIREEMIMEDGKSKKELEKLESISVIYTYTKSVPDGIGGMIDVPIPVTENYILM